MVNCLTRCLWHWDKYGGVIIYDNNHAKVIESARQYIDNQPIDLQKAEGLKSWGIDYFLVTHRDFLQPKEIEILHEYFNQ